MNAINHPIEAVSTNRFTFLVLPGFSALDLSAGIDSLAAANDASGQETFKWRLVSENGEAVRSSSGLGLSVDSDLPEVRCRDFVIVCGAHYPEYSKRIVAWLRQSKRLGAHLCGIGGGALLLAQTGIANKGRISTHWSMQPVFEECFEHLEHTCTIFEQSAQVSSCAGGAATLDLFSALIMEATGTETSKLVANQLLCGPIRPGDSRQMRTENYLLDHRNQKLLTALEIMRDNLEDAVSPTFIAEGVGISTRQLERLFSRYIGQSPKTYMTMLRLEKARLLLQQTPMRVIDVALACGFSSTGHFSKLYRKRFGKSPHTEQAGFQTVPLP